MKQKISILTPYLFFSFHLDIFIYYYLERSIITLKIIRREHIVDYISTNITLPISVDLITRHLVTNIMMSLINLSPQSESNYHRDPCPAQQIAYIDIEVQI